jgi:hypothetical protein
VLPLRIQAAAEQGPRRAGTLISSGRMIEPPKVLAPKMLLRIRAFLRLSISIVSILYFSPLPLCSLHSSYWWEKRGHTDTFLCTT